MARILVVDDDPGIQSIFRSILSQAGHTVMVAGSLHQAYEQIDLTTFDVVLLDVHLPDGLGDQALPEILARDPYQRVVMISGDLDLGVVTNARRQGAFHYYTKPFTSETLLQIIELAMDSRHEAVARALGEYAQPQISPGLTGTSPTACAVNLLIDRASKNDRTPVLISGEVGTGKELAAGIIHRLSSRSKMPFHTVNCAGANHGSVEVELFGLEVEAGPGSRHIRKGVLELAEGGTVFIRDLDKLPESLQERLISVITEGRLVRNNGSMPRPTSVRIMASTTSDLPSLAAKGQFNSALLVALAGFHIHIAPVRERVEDIAALAEDFAIHLTREMGMPAPILPAALITALGRYNWPGNARELRNVVERLVLLSNGRPSRMDSSGLHQLLQGDTLAANILHVDHLEDDAQGSGDRVRPTRGRVPSQRIDSSSVRFPNPWMVKDILPLEEVEKAYIARTLEIVRQNRTIGAKRLGISRSTLQRKLQAYGMDNEEHLVTQSPD